MAATKCQVCNNKTKDPDGLCYLHKGATSPIGAKKSMSPSISAPSLASEENGALDVRDEACGNNFAFIDESYSKGNLKDHGNGVVTGESESGNAMMVFSKVSEDDMEKRPELEESLVDGWYDREHEDHFSSTFEVKSDSEVADEIRDNAHRPDFRSWAVGYAGGIDRGYSYTNNHDRHIVRHIHSSMDRYTGEHSTGYKDIGW